MKYIKVEWEHDDDEDPILIFSEIDDALWEHRKVEVFRDGRQGFADKSEERGGSMLGQKQWPDLNVLGAEPEFNITELDAQEFERIWANRHETFE